MKGALLRLLALCLAGLVGCEKIAIIGSGSWGTSIAYKMGKLHPGAEIEMWTFEEVVDGRNLTDIINEEHTNPKYLPNVTLSHNVVASSDLQSVCRDASLLVFVVPHQFLQATLRKMVGFAPREALGVSLTKGLCLHAQGGGGGAGESQDAPPAPLELLSDMIRRELSLHSQVAVLMGANVAKDVSEDHFVEATVACPDARVARAVSRYFHSPSFQTRCSADVFTAEVCGALKNVVAMGAGFCDGLGLGSSTKAAVIRKGLCEMSLFCKLLSPPGGGYDPATVLESCGLGDVIATSFGGRNRLCAAEFARTVGSGAGAADKAALWTAVESRLLHGQKLQGLSTCAEAMVCLRERRLEGRFSLLRRIHEIAIGSASPASLVEDWDAQEEE